MLRCLISLTLLSLMATAQQPALPTAAHASFNISGTVVSDATGAPVGRATVAIGPTQRPGAQTTNTDEQGHFTFTGLAQGKYWLAAQAHGFPRQLYDEHEFFSTAIAVGDAISSEGIVFRLRPGAVLSGVITDDMNETVRNAQVMLFHDQLENGKRTTSLQQRATTDDRGQYHFSRLAAGSYFIAVTAQPWYAQHRQVTNTTTFYGSNGSSNEPTLKTTTVDVTPLDVAFPLTFYAETTDSNSATPIILKPGDRTVADVRLTAVPAVQLVLHQPNSTDFPNTSLSQRVFGNFSLPVQILNINSQGGEIKLSGVPPGQFTLNTQTTGANPTSSAQEINLDQDSEISLTKSAPALNVHGVLTLDGVQSSRNVFVQFRNKDSEEVRGSAVSDKGEFEIKDALRAGSYEIRVFNMPGAVIGEVTREGSPAVEGNTIDLLGSGPVQVGIRMLRGLGEIDGLVLKDGKPFAGAMVLLVPNDLEHHESRIRRDQSDSDGTFSLSAALPGEYRVVAIQNGWNLQWTDPNVLKPYLQHTEPVQVVANQKHKIEVQAQ
jgi:uncharacterized GH25 family protein